MKRLTPEREQEMRNATTESLSYLGPSWVDELLDEINALRAECKSNLAYSKHLQTELGDSIEYQIKLKEERDQLREELKAWHELTIGLQAENDRLKQQVKFAKHQFDIQNQNIAKLQEKE